LQSIYVGYRFFDKSGIKPLFPFGHGLSYTTFKLSDLSVSTISYEGEFEVKVTVENTGSIAGSEVVQVYVSNPSSTQATPVKELRGFTKVHLAPGKKETVSVKLDRDALRYFDERRNWWIAERAEYVVSVGTSSVDLPLKQSVKLGKTMTWLGL
jgi:beta-glucosidase